MKKEINHKIYKVFIKNYRVYTSEQLTPEECAKMTVDQIKEGIAQQK